MSRELQLFLAATDLDDVSRARTNLGTPSERDQAALQAVIRNWDDEQAVANVLFHAGLIPQPQRAQVVLQALNERKHRYYVLAAVVAAPAAVDGVGSEMRITIRDRLLALLGTGNKVIAERTTLALFDILQPEEAAIVVNLLDHPTELVRHNLLAWLMFHFDPEMSDRWAQLLENSSLRSASKVRIRQTVAQHLVNKRAGTLTNVAAPLLTYIPNLSEFGWPALP